MALVAKTKFNVSFIQGEAFRYEVAFDSQIAHLITGVNITSTNLNFSHDLTKDSNDDTRWFYLFTAEESIKLIPMRTTYSLMVHTSLDSLEPQILANQFIEIVENKNPIISEE